MSSDLAIRVSGLGKAYQRYASEGKRVRSLLFGERDHEDIWVLRDVDLEVRRGEALGVVGRNGAGKSTLLKIISGILTPSEGHSEVHGRVATLLELGAGMHPDYTGRENARFSAAIMGLSKQEYREVAEDIEKFADIGDFFDRRIYEYSSGMYARLAFSISINCHPDILIVDEILSVGDIAFQMKCLELMRAFCAAGGTLLFVSHDDGAVRALCERAIWLDDGRLAAEGATDRVLRRYHASNWALQSGAPGFEIHDEDPEQATPPEAELPDGPAEDGAPGGFDPEALQAHPVAGAITSVTVLDSRGRQMPVVHGGQRVDLRVRFHADEALEKPAVVFLIRNRLRLLLFGSRIEAEGQDAGRLAGGETAQASFVFMLPWLLSGEYILEILVTAQVDGAEKVVLRQDTNVLPVQTVHIAQGLANVRVRDVRVEPVGGAQR